MRNLAMMLALPLLAAPLPVFELADLSALFNKRDPRLRQNATIQLTGELADFIQGDGSTVLTLFDKETATAAGCEIPGKSRRDFPTLLVNHRYSVQGTLSNWQPSQKGGALLLRACQVLPEPIELRTDTLYLGVLRTGDHETGFQLKLLDGGEGPVRATFTPIDSGRFLEDWEHRNSLPLKLLLSPKPTQWTGSFSRATQSFHFSRQEQTLDMLLTSPASFAGKLTARKNLETDARMIVANSSGTLIDYPNSQSLTARAPTVSGPMQSRKDVTSSKLALELSEVKTFALQYLTSPRNVTSYRLIDAYSTRYDDSEWKLIYAATVEAPNKAPLNVGRVTLIVGGTTGKLHATTYSHDATKLTDQQLWEYLRKTDSKVKPTVPLP